MTRTKRILRTLQKIDDVAEVLLYRVLLGTRTGRQLCGIAAVTLGALLYVLSGLLFVPRAEIVTERTSGAPYFSESEWNAPSAEVRAVAALGTVDAARLPAIESQLAPVKQVLDRVKHLTQLSVFVRFSGTPPFKSCMEIADALVARGACEAARGQAQAAVDDWMAAARFGRAAGYGRGDAKNLVEAMVTTSAERRAYQAMQAELAAHPGTAVELAILRDIHRRERGELRLVADIARAEERDIMDALTHLVRGEKMTCDISDLRAVLPVRKADREKFLVEVRNAVHNSLSTTFDTRLTRWSETKPLPHTLLCSGCSEREISRLHALRAMLSRDAAVRHVALAMLPPFEPAFERMAQRDRLLRDCYQQAVKKLTSPVH